MSETSISREAFIQGYLAILTETFEGPRQEWSAFLDQGGGLFQTLEVLTPEAASTPAAPGLNTIAAHAEHTRFHLAGLNALLRGNMQKLDWRESWKVQRVDAAAWGRVQAELRQEYETLKSFARKSQDWNEEAVGGAVAVVAHVAYHLGAMRQIMRALHEGGIL